MRPDPGDPAGDALPSSKSSTSSLPSPPPRLQRPSSHPSRSLHPSTTPEASSTLPGARSSSSSALPLPSSSSSSSPQPHHHPLTQPTRQLTQPDDSPKFHHGHIAPRGHLGESSTQDFSWPTSTSSLTYTGDQGHLQQNPSPEMIAPSPLVRHDHDHRDLSYSAYDGAYPLQWPASTDQSTILSGASAGYYGPDISSEALGMVDAAPNLQIEIPDRTRSYSSSLKYSMKQVFGPKSGQDRIVSSHAPTPDSEDPHSSLNPGQLHQQPGPSSYTNEALAAQSSMDFSDDMALSDASMHHDPLHQGATYHQEDDLDTPSQTTLPNDQQLHTAGTASPTYSYPDMGTVNPMDIMPATTEKELWYRNEHQVYFPYDQIPEGGPSSEQAALEYASMIAQSQQPLDAQFQAQQMMQANTPTAAGGFSMEEDAERDDIVMAELPLSSHLNAGYSSSQSRRMSYSSEQPTPNPAASTNASSHNTPSTMLDSPSPESASSSDFRYSASPQLGQSVPLPRNALFRCDEAGCNQVFDQPHKLKHHQRYHSKDHKCTYPGCGKGFGTKTHLQRHINDRHEKKKKYHCAITGCDYSKAGGKAFPRKDNWKRHMTKIHNMDSNHLPEPVEVDP